MNKPGSACAPRGAAGGASRPSHRRRKTRRPEWVRPYRRAQQALDSAAKRIQSTIHVVMEAGRCATRRPIRTARRLTSAVWEINVALQRLRAARQELAEANEALARDLSPQRGDGAELMEIVAERYEAVAKYIPIVLKGVVIAQADVLGGLYTGELVAEKPSDSRPRIVVTPHPLFVRAFLVTRQPRVSDRITPVLLRRRRTPRPAEVQVPRPDVQGRAPPVLTCAF